MMTRRQATTLLAAAMLIAAPGAAAGQGFGFGGKAGVNLTTVTFERDDSLKGTAKPGLVAGGFVTLPVVLKLHLQVDVLWSERVSEFEGTVEDKLSYVEIPVLVRFGFHPEGRWRGFVIGGVSSAFLQKATESVGGNEGDIKSAVKSQEYSVFVGGQVQIGRRWLADARYLFGVTNVYAATNFPAKQRTLQITGAYILR